MSTEPMSTGQARTPDAGTAAELEIRQARGEDDVLRASAVIAEAFSGLAASVWLVPDDLRERTEVLTRVFTITVTHALEHGVVHLAVPRSKSTEDSTGTATATAARTVAGVAVWLDRTRPLPEIPEYDARLRAAADAHYDRFVTLDLIFDQHHPVGPHHHLAFLAAAAQGCGVGSALLRHHHAVLDKFQLPAYLEAASEAGVRLYARHGYQQVGQAFLPTGGVRFWPMWRQPYLDGPQ